MLKRGDPLQRRLRCFGSEKDWAPRGNPGHLEAKALHGQKFQGELGMFHQAAEVVQVCGWQDLRTWKKCKQKLRCLRFLSIFDILLLAESLKHIDYFSANYVKYYMSNLLKNWNGFMTKEIQKIRSSEYFSRKSIKILRAVGGEHIMLAVSGWNMLNPEMTLLSMLGLPPLPACHLVPPTEVQAVSPHGRGWYGHVFLSDIYAWKDYVCKEQVYLETSTLRQSLHPLQFHHLKKTPDWFMLNYLGTDLQYHKELCW